jgi:tRNA pseudouridine13 synthase
MDIDQEDRTAAQDAPASRLPSLTSKELSIRGRIKVQPEDFVVEEVPAYEPSGAGEHLYLWIEKRDISADFLLGHLARQLGIRRDDIGSAGLKDRRAVTRQWISVPGSAEDRMAAIDTDQIQVLRSARHGNKLRAGHLKGNLFEILVRDVAAESLPAARRIAHEIELRGVPNYFGEQRFGIDGETLELGMSLLRGEALARDVPWKKRKFLTRLALSAAQSALFNAVLSRRLLEGTLHRVASGDVMQVVSSGGLFLAEDADIEQARFDRRETVITGPMFGPKMKSPTGRAFELEQEILHEARLSQEIFRVHKKLTSGTRRPLLIWPQDLSVSDDPVGLRLKFTLPSGAYATVVLAEFLKEVPENRLSPPSV